MSVRFARSLRARLTIALVLVAVAVIGLAVMANVALRNLGGAIGTILVENYASVIACEDMSEALERLDSAALFSVSGKDEIARPMFAANRPAFEAALDRERHNITLSGEGELAASVTRDYAAYNAKVDALLADPRTKTTDSYFKELLPRFTALKEHIHAILRMNQASMERADRVARETARTTTTRNAAIGIAIVLLALTLALWLPAALVRPLGPMLAATEEIAEGRWDATLPTPDVEELVPLARAFHTMLEKLRAYRKSSLGELLAAKDLARATIASLDDPVVVLDRDGSVLLASPPFERMFGVGEATRQELDARGVALPEAITDAAERVMANGEPVRPTSLREAMKHADRDVTRYFLVRAAPLYREGDELAKAIVIAEDVTRLHTIDDAKSSIVATVSHELKTPLTSLRMATHLLLEPHTGPLTDVQRELATTARDDTERLRKLVEEFLDLTRIEAEAGALMRTRLEVSRLFEDTMSAHKSLAEQKGVTLSIEGDARAVVLGDAEKLGIVLANLVSNAIRHTSRGGIVAMSAATEGARVIVSIRDTGEGISKEALPRIFDRFQRGRDGEEDVTRMGLGLAIAREIVQQHGGALRVESEPGRGTTFRIELPSE